MVAISQSVTITGVHGLEKRNGGRGFINIDGERGEEGIVWRTRWVIFVVCKSHSWEDPVREVGSRDGPGVGAFNSHAFLVSGGQAGGPKSDMTACV